jgi:hypothetical protein
VGSDIGLRPAPSRGKHVLDTFCGGHYADLEQIFDDTPLGASVRRSATARLESADPVPALGRHIEFCAQREPHLARVHAGGKGIGTGAAADLGKDEIRDDGVGARAELIVHRASEFTEAHGCGRLLNSVEGRFDALRGR